MCEQKSAPRLIIQDVAKKRQNALPHYRKSMVAMFLHLITFGYRFFKNITLYSHVRYIMSSKFHVEQLSSDEVVSSERYKTLVELKKFQIEALRLKNWHNNHVTFRSML